MAGASVPSAIFTPASTARVSDARAFGKMSAASDLQLGRLLRHIPVLGPSVRRDEERAGVDEALDRLVRGHEPEDLVGVGRDVAVGVTEVMRLPWTQT